MRMFATALVGIVAVSVVGIRLRCNASVEPLPGGEVGGSPLWFVGMQPTPQAVSITAELLHAAERGLRSTDYGIGDIIRVAPKLAGGAGGTSPDPTPASVARIDSALTVAIERIVADLHSGRVNPREVGYDLDVARPTLDTTSFVQSLAQAGSISKALDSLEPQFLHYRLLKTVLARYRQLAVHPELNSLPDPGKTSVRAGGLYLGAPALRTLLVALGDLSARWRAPVRAVADDQDVYLDPDLVRALKVFQARHGLGQDGALGPDTYRALTTPFAERVTQIELSLERWRWLPPQLDTPSIIVNIPEFRLFALYTTADLEEQMLRMDVIVGKSFPIMQTPVFAADMRYVVLHPYWDVPPSIVRRELLTLIRRDPNFIERNGYEIVQGQTDAAAIQPVTPETVDALAHGRLRLRQKPSPINPLGFVKFMLPNRHNVYLHGTSAPALFAGAQRAFSHGCVRVADPMALLTYVLRDTPAWDRERVQGQLEQPGTYRINLRAPIRVFIVYATALAAEDGRALFFRDIYGEDAKLQRLLDSRSKRLAPPAMSGRSVRG